MAVAVNRESSGVMRAGTETAGTKAAVRGSRDKENSGEQQ